MSDQSAELFAVVYQELRALAAARLRREPAGQTLQPTALVHEVYLRLVAVDSEARWDSVGHFFAAAAQAMRRILIDHARRKLRRPRATGNTALMLTLPGVSGNLDESQLIELDESLTEFELADPQKARLVLLRYFGGLSIEQTCEVTGLSRTTANRNLTYARAWLHRRMTAKSKSADDRVSKDA